MQTLATAIHARGILGLYSGFQSSLLSEMTGTGLGFMAYEAGNQWWERTHGHKPTPAQKGGIGAASAFVVMTCTMPLELIQRRMQVRNFAICQPYLHLPVSCGEFDAPVQCSCSVNACLAQILSRNLPSYVSVHSPCISMDPCRKLQLHITLYVCTSTLILHARAVLA
jgi:hypothetical protein